jgi:hypothetical protein
MDVEISNDNGDSWALVETVADVESAWFEKVVYITDYITVLTDQMQVRFSVQDVPSNSIDEGGIDAFEVFEVECGEFENSDTPYGTFDQGGNVWEWNEAILYGSYRGLRGGSFYLDDYLHAAIRSYFNPAYEYSDVGFRVAEVP